MRRSQFGQAVQLKIAPHVGFTRERAGFYIAWAAFEGSEALNNPFDTTEPYEGATDYNSVGVKNYLTWQDGVEATVRTLVNGYYEHLLKVIRDKDSTVRELLNALDATPWGSHPTTLLYQDVMLEYGKYDSEVAGSPKFVAPLLGQYNKNAVIPEIVKQEKEDNKMSDETTEAVDTPEEDTLEARLVAAGLAPTPVAPPESQVVEEPVEEPVPDDPDADTLEKRLAAQTSTETDTPKDEQ